MRKQLVFYQVIRRLFKREYTTNLQYAIRNGAKSIANQSIVFEGEPRQSRLARGGLLQLVLARGLRVKCAHRFNPTRIQRLVDNRLTLHARRQVFRRTLWQHHALVFLRIGQARVHRQREGRVVARSIEGIELSPHPQRLRTKKKAFATWRPKSLVKNGSNRLKKLAILAQRIARNEIERATAACARRISASALCTNSRGAHRTCAPRTSRGQTLSRYLRFHYSIGIKTLNAAVAQTETNWVHLTTHGIGHNRACAAHARNLRAPCNRIKR